MATRKAAASKTTKKKVAKKSAKNASKKTSRKTGKKPAKQAGVKKKAKAGGSRKAGSKSPVTPAMGLWPTHDEIAVRAFEVWERTGKPEGHDYYNWKQAEAELIAERGLA